jgi:hypothetical protein
LKLIYTAGPYGAPSVWGISRNIERAREAAAHLWAQGWAVICPHSNTAFMDGCTGEDFEKTRAMFLSGDIEMLQRCDAIYMLRGWRDSPGAQEELGVAIKAHLEIHYQGLKED